MAAKGLAAKSASGASMSKYDVEVEKRLQALEAQAHKPPTGATQKKDDERLAALEAEAHPKCHHGTEEGDSDRVSVLEARLDKLVNTLKKHYGDID